MRHRQQICQKAAMCSVGGDAGVVFVIGPDEEASINSYPFSVNSEPGCEVLIGSGCNGSHAVAFTANCKLRLRDQQRPSVRLQWGTTTETVS
jgi:hypothetical protein